jgi:hypothetical protein
MAVCPAALAGGELLGPQTKSRPHQGKKQISIYGKKSWPFAFSRKFGASLLNFSTAVENGNRQIGR